MQRLLGYDHSKLLGRCPEGCCSLLHERQHPDSLWFFEDSSAPRLVLLTSISWPKIPIWTHSPRHLFLCTIVGQLIWQLGGLYFKLAPSHFVGWNKKGGGLNEYIQRLIKLHALTWFIFVYYVFSAAAQQVNVPDQSLSTVQRDHWLTVRINIQLYTILKAPLMLLQGG